MLNQGYEVSRAEIKDLVSAWTIRTPWAHPTLDLEHTGTLLRSSKSKPPLSVAFNLDFISFSSY
jgi:hypothetical protein